jgi:hypothetical protein
MKLRDAKARVSLASRRRGRLHIIGAGIPGELGRVWRRSSRNHPFPTAFKARLGDVHRLPALGRTVAMAGFDNDGSVQTKGPFSGPRADLGRRAQATDTIIIAGAVIAALYFGHEVLVPIALAVLLSFVLAPVAATLARAHIGRTVSVLLSVCLAFAILAGLGALIGKQVAQLADNLPEYQLVIGKKLEAVRSSGFGRDIVERAADALHGLDANIGRSSTQPQTAPVAGVRPPPADQPLMQVEVHEPSPVGDTGDRRRFRDFHSSATRRLA